MRVTHIINKVGRTSFGLGEVAVNLVRHQNVDGCSPTIWCVDREEEVEWVLQAAELKTAQIRRFDIRGPKIFSYAPAMEKQLARIGEGPDVIHQHSIWSGLSRVTSVGRKHLNVPTIVAAQGALQPWALRKSSWKKKLASMAYESANLNSASCLHACGENEIKDYRDFSLRNPIALIPNGISSYWINASTNPTRFREKHHIPEDTRILLSVSRITPKKGLPMLLEALHELGGAWHDWIFLIAGFDEFNHQVELETMIDRLNLRESVRFIGPIHGDEKRNAFSAADLFTLPSYSEGNPLAVLEALGAGVPVITTQGTPWRDLVTHKCGWWTEVSSSGLTGALQEALAKSKSDLMEIGLRGKTLVSEKYEWKHIAKRSIDLYDWLTTGGPKPEFVEMF